MRREAPNINALWGSLLVEELVRNGVTHFVIAPGSRSTPLVQAVARNPKATYTVWLDERGAAYHALGRARAIDWPTAVITTSGTAVANLLPAAVEAYEDGVPLIFLTADRPPELRETGANQSIRQTQLLTSATRWSFDLPCPDDRIPARTLLTTVDHAVQRALDRQRGPVQLNCPFREPLAPNTEAWDAACLDGLEHWFESETPFTETDGGEARPIDLSNLARAALEASSGLLICGALPGYAAVKAVKALAVALGWPVWGDVRSGLRLGGDLAGQLPHLDRILDRYDELAPEMVIQVGGRLTSKRLQEHLDGGQASRYALVDAGPDRMDPGHRVTDRFVADVEAWCLALAAEVGRARKDETAAALPASLLTYQKRIEAAIESGIESDEALSEPWVARWLSRHMDASHGLFLSSSMPIRDMQSYAVADGPALRIAANRGASGIDGVVSSAAGFAAEHGEPTTLLIGDLALLHDVNALANLATLEEPLTIIVLNNGGGSIFSFLPVAGHEDVLDPYVNTPHSIQFRGLCTSFRLPYAHVEDRDGFTRAYDKAKELGRSCMIEVKSSLAGNLASHRALEIQIEDTLLGETT